MPLTFYTIVEKRLTLKVSILKILCSNWFFWSNLELLKSLKNFCKNIKISYVFPSILFKNLRNFWLVYPLLGTLDLSLVNLYLKLINRCYSLAVLFWSLTYYCDKQDYLLCFLKSSALEIIQWRFKMYL